MSPSTNPISHSTLGLPSSKMLEAQAYLNETCVAHGMAPPFLLAPQDFPQNLPEGDSGDITALFGGSQDPLLSVDTDTDRLSGLSTPPLPQCEVYSPDPSQSSSFPFFVQPRLEKPVATQTQISPDSAPCEREDLTNQSHSFSSFDHSLSLIHHASDTSRNYNNSRKYTFPTAPSKRRSLPHDCRLPALGPYPAPSVHPFSQRHSRDCISPAPKIYLSENNQSDRHDLPGISQVGQVQEAFSLQEGHHAPQEIRLHNGRRIQVPLNEWCPERALKRLNDFGLVEFWSIEDATGTRIRGTYLTDRFRDDTGRSFPKDKIIPFPNKREKGFNLHILWPGYPKFSKKISIHSPLSNCSLKQVRDWVFNALSDFIRVAGPLQGQGNGFWRVGGDEEADVIHLDDIVLVRLKQVGRGSWVPELDIVD